MKKRKVLGICLGNLFEHYDSGLFALLSPFLAPILFPHHGKLVALLLTYLILPLGMISRPLGAFIFSRYSAKAGVEKAIFVSLTGMGIVSGLMAFIPTYEQAGWLVPLFFALGRVIQNIFAAGESVGGGVYLLEQVDEKKHDFYSGLYGSTSIGGHLVASFCIALLAKYGLVESGWRYLYFFGASTACIAAVIRKGSVETTLKKVEEKVISKSSFVLIVLVAVTSGFSYVTYVMALVVVNGFVPMVSTVTKAEMMNINTSLILFDFCLLPLFGWIASKVDREYYMMGTVLMILMAAIPLLGMLEGATYLQVVGIRTCFVILGVAFCAPFYAWVGDIIPKEKRYSVVSMGYALGSQIIGGPAAYVSLWCYKKTGIVSSIGIYWMVVGVLAFVSLLWATLLRRKNPLIDLRHRFRGKKDSAVTPSFHR